ncbi:unnamed protein product [Caenorhabditis bovis]|uniref:Uncharacterized protein n=1 Tax=Caenorhabditis bovis TaxID=2654633 RepID=A0A8S1FAQ7_9PELO|nr:unnamed protein product [Caenorhabditis bovis]
MSKTNLKEPDDSQMSLTASIYAEYERILLRVIDTKPLSPTFPRHLLTELYIARTILFAAFTLGVRIGSLQLVYTLVGAVFGPVSLFVLTYAILPALGVYAAYAYYQNKLKLDEIRVILLLWAMSCGMLSATHNIHYSLSDYGQPTYFMPVIVGIMVHLIGNRFDNDRKGLIVASVGSALAVSVSLLICFGTTNEMLETFTIPTLGQFSFSAFTSVCIATLNAVVGLQLMIADLDTT